MILEDGNKEERIILRSLASSGISPFSMLSFVCCFSASAFFFFLRNDNERDQKEMYIYLFSGRDFGWRLFIRSISAVGLTHHLTRKIFMDFFELVDLIKIRLIFGYFNIIGRWVYFFFFMKIGGWVYVVSTFNFIH